VESIGNLNGGWCAEPDSISNAETPIARDNPGTGMRSKPGRQSGRLIVRQHVERSALRQVHQQQPVAQWSSMQREIIHSQLGRRLSHPEFLVPQQTAQGIWTGWQTRSSRESGTGFATSSLSKRQ
jgi:hypothetical protein